MTIKPTFLSLSFFSIFLLTGCGSNNTDGPPQIRLGDSVCAECGMIASDERFATATIIEDERGPAPLIFDDFNCQIIFESKHADLKILNRWSHDYPSSVWFKTDEAWFVRSDLLRTPMASNLAAFINKPEAQSLADELNGEVLDFSAVWIVD